MDSPVVSTLWQSLSAEARIDRVAEVAGTNPEFRILTVVSCNDEGRVIVTFESHLEAKSRGTLLRHYERALKESIDAGLTVWCEAAGDMNALRKFRGIKVRSI